MAQQDEVSGLRDIIRHDVMMDAKTLELIGALRLAVLDHYQDVVPSFGDHVVARLDEIEKCIQSTLADANKTAGLVTEIQLVLADRPE